MEKKVDMMIKCRSIFLYNIGLIYEDFSIINNEYLYFLLDGFLKDFIDSNFETFNLLYYFTIDGDNLVINEEDKWKESLDNYLNDLINNNVDKIAKIYDDVGYKNITKITELVLLFYNYVTTLNDMNKLRIRN